MRKTPETVSDKGATGNPAGRIRDDRLKAALKVNMARRKAQARARGDTANGRSDDRTDNDG